jgi:hypothetical protein
VLDATLIECASMKTRLLPILAVLTFPAPSFAQLATPSAAGAALGHSHINSTDVEAQSPLAGTK